MDKQLNFESLFWQFKEKTISGRYINPGHIEPLLLKYKKGVQIVGNSVMGRPIYALTIGKGNIRILMWSQMHGNESTTTKALFDFFNLLNSDTPLAEKIKENFTFFCIPMLNPDGAEVYTRENSNGIDLNRDAQNLSQPESKTLRNSFDSFKPHYCYNLHDQRTIFGLGDLPKPATVSFLAPAFDESRQNNENRIKAMHVIVAMNRALQQFIPDQVGRFDDTFNLNCVGDTFQALQVPTILFEAGHYQNDYDREGTRKFIFIALLSGLLHINENVIVNSDITDYLNIPQNKVCFYDLVYKNVRINYDANEIITNFAAQYKEELIDTNVTFKAYFTEIGSIENRSGHFEYDAKGAKYFDQCGNVPKLDESADFYLDAVQVVNGMIKS